MAQESASRGFRYPVDIRNALEPLRDKLSDDSPLNPNSAEFDRAVSFLSDRDRALEDHLAASEPTFDQVLTEESTTSLTFTDLATAGPEVTVKLPRGRCILTAGAYVTCTVTNQTAVVGLEVDGSSFGDIVLLGNNSGGSIGASLSATFLFTEANGLTPGTHTFKLVYLSSDGNTVRFAGRNLLVDPIV